MNKLWTTIDSGVAWLKGKMSAEGLEKLNSKLQSLANKGIPVAIGVLLLSGVAMSAKLDDTDYIMTGIGSAIGVIALGYLSYRFAEGCRNAGSGDRSRLSLVVYLDIVVVLLALSSLGLFFGGIASLLDGDFSQTAAMWSGAFICLIISWTFSNEEQLGVHIDTDSGASNDLLSLYSVLLRATLRAALPVSSFVVIVATVMTLLSLIGLMGSDGLDSLKYTAGITAGTSTILAGVAAPVLVYLNYVFLAFIVGFAENILAIKDVARNTRSTVSSPAQPTASNDERME
jgi:hypothetical protein